jgi:hypothetical protein
MPPDPAILDEYRRRHAQACANFEADRDLSAADRDRFFTHLQAYAGGEFDDYVNVFFYDPATQKLGPVIASEPNEVLGTVRAVSSLASRFTTANGFDHDPLDAEEYVRDLTFLNAGGLTATLRSLFTPAARITGFLMWSYRNPPHFNDPFRDIDRTDLVCRLALPGYGVGEHIAFGHQAPPDPLHAPTCFDAGLTPEWRPGGNTNPLPDCAAKYPTGLPEIVHDPNIFHNIVTALYLVS